MEASRLRQVWSIIETIHASTLLALEESDLSNLVIRQIDRTSPLSLEENKLLTDYIQSKTALIRDLAEARLV